ncbi:chromate efflux transporter [Mucilaginibacter pedocola]|uniref:Chromate transporter n=1 Tax=Mucilaginibacter pedocola TaxID=1792845 RepID=A0A1S9PEX9_9SPHI|nr:chromate efflux transporter [Mucilaginibacter pedocola]OOQ59513.1 hypothetical protein BC343_04875 [Mucilaginibacter pedocola]
MITINTTAGTAEGPAEAVAKQASLSYLFFTFLRIGMVAFGGHMALVAVIQREMAEKDKTVSEELIIDGVSIATLLPGPVAVNVVAYIGNHLKGIKGAAISMLGMLLPACTLMLALSWVYFNYGYKTNLAGMMAFTSGTVSAIILSTGVNFYKKDVHGTWYKVVTCAITVLATILFKGYFVTLGLIAAGGLFGYFRPAPTQKGGAATRQSTIKLSMRSKIALGILGLVELGFLSNAASFVSNTYLKLVSVFSGISLSLFGGGYVMVPLMQALLINNLNWLSNQQFADSITFSQVTPGPILVSALFVGFKLAGVLGGLLAVVSIFVPSATLMLVVSGFFNKNKQSQTMQRILAGIKPVVVGMIIASAIILMKNMALNAALIATVLIAFTLSFRFKVSPVYLILGSLFVGFLINYL